MNDRRKSNKQKSIQLGLLIFECGMAILYLFFAVIFIAPSILGFQLHNVQDGLRITIGVIVGIYGIFRIFRCVNRIREFKNVEE